MRSQCIGQEFESPYLHKPNFLFHKDLGAGLLVNYRISKKWHINPFPRPFSGLGPWRIFHSRLLSGRGGGFFTLPSRTGGYLPAISTKQEGNGVGGDTDGLPVAEGRHTKAGRGNTRQKIHPAGHGKGNRHYRGRCRLYPKGTSTMRVSTILIS